ncbi:MAG: BatA and WFA domain-containing protein [Phycisphaerales bacterium]
MTWLTPWLAIWAGAIVLPALLILYFLKLKRREMEVSTTLLWKKAIQDLQANAPFQRLRNNILLLLQLLALLLVLAALGQPELRAAATEATRHVILIDRSASMQATDGGDGRTRLEAAKDEALAFIDALRDPGVGGGGFFGELFGTATADEAMVIAFDATADVLQPFTSDKAALRRAVERVTPSDATTTIDEALRLAGAYARPELIEDQGLVTTGPVAALHLYSDGRIADALQAVVPAQSPLTYHRVGGAEPGANASVTAIRAERAYDNPDLVSIFAGVQREADASPVDVELVLDGRVVAVRAVDLLEGTEPGDPATGGVVFTINRPRGGLARVRIVGDDALAVDNEASVVVPDAQRVAVGLVTSGNLFLQSALEGLNLSRLVVMTAEEMATPAGRETLDALDVVVLDGVDVPTIDDATRPGRYLVLGLAPSMPGLAPGDGGGGGAQVVLDWQRDHPAMELAGLQRLVIGEASSMAVEAPAVTLAEGERGPVIAEAFDGPARAVVVAFDPAASTWPFDPGFVLFLASAVQHLGEDEAAPSGEGLRPGDTLTTRLAGRPSEVELVTPRGQTLRLIPGAGGVVTYGPLRETGLYRLRWRGEPGAGDTEVGGRIERTIAVNLADPAESRIAPAETLELASRTVEETAGAGDGTRRRRLWPWLLLGALGVVMFEWFIYNRRVAI